MLRNGENMSRIAVFLADGFEEIEALTVVDLCRRAGIETVMVSVMGREAVTGAHGIAVQADTLIEKTEFDTLDMLMLPGGMPGTRNLEGCGLLMEKLDAFYRAEKPISAICAAPSIFGHRGYLQGRRACCYPGFEGQLAGAEVTLEQVEVSGHITTSRGMGTAIPLGLAIVERFCGSRKAEELAEGICYRNAVKK